MEMLQFSGFDVEPWEWVEISIRRFNPIRPHGLAMPSCVALLVGERSPTEFFRKSGRPIRSA